MLFKKKHWQKMLFIKNTFKNYKRFGGILAKNTNSYKVIHIQFRKNLL